MSGHDDLPGFDVTPARYPVPFIDQLRRAMAAYLARFTGSSRSRLWRRPVWQDRVGYAKVLYCQLIESSKLLRKCQPSSSRILAILFKVAIGS